MKYTLAIFVISALFVGCSISKITDLAPALSREHKTVWDDLGRKLTVPVEIKRIVSLAPSATELIYAVGAGDRLVGVTTFCNYPEQAQKVAKVGDTMNPNMESIIALQPDVVVVSTASQIETFSKTLNDRGIAVYVTDPKSLDEVIRTLRKLEELFNTKAIAEPVIKDLVFKSQKYSSLGLQENETLEAYTNRVKPVRVFVQISKEPLFTVGSASFVTNIVSNSGGTSVTSEVESAYPKISKETAASYNPEAIILSESDDNKEPNEVFKNSPAIKNGRVLKVNADILSRPGPRLIDAMEQIAKFLHPEKFK